MNCNVILKSVRVTLLAMEKKAMCYIFSLYYYILGTAVAQWLRCCATNWKVAGSIPDSVIGFFIDIKILPIALSL